MPLVDAVPIGTPGSHLAGERCRRKPLRFRDLLEPDRLVLVQRPQRGGGPVGDASARGRWTPTQLFARDSREGVTARRVTTGLHICICR
jgi:hypothetical protein